ncbi:LuxR C-terminal-related transcriptional regulator [Streptomyces sp. NPDC059215]|uniref:LuxR C-terminal-related transcriptional regulator n=1 Tax=Streptomyces sp. NPDC059215 TaxID=3346772 RepID=UPI00369CC5FF
MDVTSDSPWSGMGLDPNEGRLLEHLVSVPAADTATLAKATGIPDQDVEAALQRLEQALLVRRSNGLTPQWAASPPRPSVGARLAHRRVALARAEELVERLHTAYEATTSPRTSPLLEVLEHQDEVAARYVQLLQGSTTEVLHLAKPPYVTPKHSEHTQPGVPDGVELRSVYETGTLTDAVSLETALRGTAGGGELRLASQLPIKLVIFDRAAALLPVRDDHPSVGSLVVHSPALVAALTALFESLWEGAAPVALSSHQGPSMPDRAPRQERVDERTREILRLMSTGMKDDTIARVLKVSRRTVQKHVTDAGTALGAKTRFQLARLAAGRGWL